MSAAASRWAWAVRGVTPTQKLILVCLADHAGKDGGNAFPSVRLVAEECCVSERAVQYAMRQLAAAGMVESRPRAGRTTVYSLPIEGCTPCTPATDAPLQEVRGRGARGAGEGCTPCTHNHQEPSPNRKKKEKTRGQLDFSGLPGDLSPKVWADFMESRKLAKHPVNTQTIIDRLCLAMEACRRAGFTPNESLGEAIERGWRTVKPDWMENAKGTSNGSRKLRGTFEESIDELRRIAGE